MRSLSSKLILSCFILTLVGLGNAQENSYPTWKHELQDLLGLEQSGKADRATFDALVSYLEELDLMDDQLGKGYDGMGGYLGFQIYLDNNQEWLMDTLRYDEDEGFEDIEEDEEDILDEEEEEDLDLDFFGEEEDMEFDDSDIDIGDVKKGFAGFGGEGGDRMFSFHSIGFDVGMYGPSMSYWNNEFIEDGHVHFNPSVGELKVTGFAMGPLFQGSATFKIGSKIRIALSGGMWSGTATIDGLTVVGVGTEYIRNPNAYPEGTMEDQEIAKWNTFYNGLGDEEKVTYDGVFGANLPRYQTDGVKKLTVQLMPLTGMVAYELFGGFYLGGGIGTNQVTHKETFTFTDPDAETSNAGTLESGVEKSFSGVGSRTILCAGYELPLGPLALGIQAQYILGKYQQDVINSGDKSELKDVGTDGIQFLVNLGYSFGE